MTEKIAVFLDYAAVALFFLWIVGHLFRIIPHALARRIAKREPEWNRDTVETDRFGLIVILFPAIALSLPGLFRLVTGLSTGVSLGMLLLAAVFTAAVLFNNMGPRLRYNGRGIYVRGGNGKEYFVPWERIQSVQWQIGGDPSRKLYHKRPRLPTVVIRYTAELFGKTVTDIYYLDPTLERGIRRFTETWCARHGEEEGE